MDRVARIIEIAAGLFRERLELALETGGLSLERYVRYLSMQYHLTNGVQKHFLSLAAHPAMRGRRALREFLVGFGWEEEMHYEIARRDLERLGREVLPCPLDARLWWLYFDSAVADRPFIRLGGTCVLENLGTGGGDLVKRLLAEAPYLDKTNSRFIQIHLHEQLPHGQQILDAIEGAKLEPEELADLEQGAREAATIYLRLAAWALEQDPVIERLAGVAR